LGFSENEALTGGDDLSQWNSVSNPTVSPSSLPPTQQSLWNGFTQPPLSSAPQKPELHPTQQSPWNGFTQLPLSSAPPKPEPLSQNNNNGMNLPPTQQSLWNGFTQPPLSSAPQKPELHPTQQSPWNGFTQSSLSSVPPKPEPLSQNNNNGMNLKNNNHNLPNDPIKQQPPPPRQEQNTTPPPQSTPTTNSMGESYKDLLQNDNHIDYIKQQLTPERIAQATQHTKYALAALHFDDVPTALYNIGISLSLLTGHQV